MRCRLTLCIPAEMIDTGQASDTMSLAAAMMSMVATFPESVKNLQLQVLLSCAVLLLINGLSATNYTYMLLQRSATAPAILIHMQL